MSLVMFQRALKDLRWTVAWYAIGLFLYELMILSLYPSVFRNNAAMRQLLATYPQGMLRAFGVTDLTSFAGFLGGEFLNFMWPLIVAIFTIMTGAGLVGQEVERGTIELWLSVPASRARLLTAKLAAFLVALAVLVLATIVALVFGAALIGERLALSGVVALALVLLALTVAIGGYATFFSSFASDRGKPAGLAAGLTLAFYLCWVIGGLSNRWSWLKRLSIFSAYQPQQALARGEVPVLETALLLAIGLICTIGAIAIFQRRDAIA